MTKAAQQAQARGGRIPRMAWLPGMALLMIAPALWSADCAVNASGMEFGSYDAFSNQSLDGAANISVTCDVGTAYSLALSPGAGSYEVRAMAFGLHRLFYNLYTDATLATVWGDGSGDTAIVAAVAPVASHTVYGRIPARQNAYVGIYADTIVVTVTF